tara:strand:- start:211 stop:621 length:411 start_codon:yes stop_codon:yes gene_type:complete
MKAQDLLKKGNRVVACRNFRGAEMELLKNSGQYPKDLRMGVITDIGLKDNEIVVDFQLLMESDEDGEKSFYKMPSDETKPEEERTAWCYLNQVLEIIEKDEACYSQDMIWQIDEEPVKNAHLEEPSLFTRAPWDRV